MSEYTQRMRALDKQARGIRLLAEAAERERIARILERELVEDNDPTRSAAERAYRKAYNERTMDIVRRLRGDNRGGPSLCG